MISKSLSRRLERLEEEASPGEPKIMVLRIIGLRPDGRHVSGPEFKVEMPPCPMRRNSRANGD